MAALAPFYVIHLSLQYVGIKNNLEKVVMEDKSLLFFNATPTNTLTNIHLTLKSQVYSTHKCNYFPQNVFVQKYLDT